MNIVEFLNKCNRTVNNGDSLCINNLIDYESEFLTMDINGDRLEFLDINGDVVKGINIKDVKEMQIFRRNKDGDIIDDSNQYYRGYAKANYIFEDCNGNDIGGITLEESLFDELAYKSIINLKSFDVADMNDESEYFNNNYFEVRLMHENKIGMTKEEIVCRTHIAMEFGKFQEARKDDVLGGFDDFKYCMDIVEELHIHKFITDLELDVMKTQIKKFLGWDGRVYNGEYYYDELDEFLGELHPFIKECL